MDGWCRWGMCEAFFNIVISQDAPLRTLHTRFLEYPLDIDGFVVLYFSKMINETDHHSNALFVKCVDFVNRFLWQCHDYPPCTFLWNAFINVSLICSNYCCFLNPKIIFWIL